MKRYLYKPTVEFLSHEVDGEHLGHAPHPGRVYLAELEGVCLQELLEHDPVLAHLSCSHAYAQWRQRLHTGWTKLSAMLTNIIRLNE